MPHSPMRRAHLLLLGLGLVAMILAPSAAAKVPAPPSPQSDTATATGSVTGATNGGAGLDRFGVALASSPTDCSADVAPADQPLNGRAAVRDAQPPLVRNPWLGRRVLNMAHQGGEFEAPSNTMYAFKRAVAQGADMLELDVHATVDGRLAVIHDATVNRTTDGAGLVSGIPWHRLRELDAAYNFVPGRNAVGDLDPSAYPLRGVRTGERKPPHGYHRRDFRVPLLSEVFRRFPRTPINIEIKGDADSDQASFDRNAELLARFLNKRPKRADDVIVVSFNDAALARFRQLAPGSSIAPGLGAVTSYFLTSVPPPPGTVAIQIPVQFQGIPVATREFIARAHADGFAVHVFPDADEESDALYQQLLASCVDGIMTAFPSRFERYLRQNRIVRPRHPGIDPCE